MALRWSVGLPPAFGAGIIAAMLSDSRQPLHRRLHVQILAAMGLGLMLGGLGGQEAASWVGWMGEIFVRLLRMVIVPLVLTSIVSGVTTVGSGRSLGRLGIKTFSYYITTSLLAILVGLFLVNVIRPGRFADLVSASRAELPELETPSSLTDIFLRLIPTNPVEAMGSTDMLGIIFFGLVLGVTIAHLPQSRRERLSTLFDDLFEAMMLLTGGIIKLAPIGVFGLMTRAVASTGLGTFGALGMYMLTIIFGLAIHVGITLPLLLTLLGRMKPWVHYRNMSEALLMAFSTSSSSATLPLTIRCVEQRVGVSNKIASFTLPMGATINMDGTALYECVGVIFISQVLGYGLDLGAQVIVVLTALLASIGAAGVPSAGLVMIFIVTEAVNLRGPEVSMVIGTMLAIDRPLDMMRTMTNVLSDSCGAAIIARSEGEVEVNST